MILRMLKGSRSLAVVGLVSACTIAGPRPGEPTPPPDPPPPDVPAIPALPAAEPELRVGLRVDVDTVTVDAGGRFDIVDDAGRVRASGRAGETWTSRRSGGGIEIQGPTGTVRVRGPLVVRPAEGVVARIDGKPYRGSVLLRPAARGITAVNVLDIETYLLGVVPLEIGAGRPPEELEAVKAQAIAARTYAIRHMGRRSALGFDVYATVMDQVYGGADAEDPVSSRAVRDTRGEILVHDGAPVEAYYHSTCGGRTAALEEVWPGEPRPYLRSVSDRKPDGGWYCETSNRFRWSEEWSQAELVATLNHTYRDRGVASGEVTRVDHVAIAGRTPSGRVAMLRIGTNLGEHRVGGDSIRWILRPEPGRILNSAAITVHFHGAEQIERLDVEGSGWGHGIGMCQVGALGRARDGHSYRDILSAYYPGSRTERLYR